MVKFIKQEAEEKANEISVSAEEVCRVHRDTDQSNCLCMHPSQNVEQLCVPFMHPSQERRSCLGTLMTISILPVFSCSALNCCVSQEFNIEKLQLLEAEKAKIRKDYERREGQIDVKKKMYVISDALLSALDDCCYDSADV